MDKPKAGYLNAATSIFLQFEFCINDSIVPIKLSVSGYVSIICIRNDSIP